MLFPTKLRNIYRKTGQTLHKTATKRQPDNNIQDKWTDKETKDKRSTGTRRKRQTNKWTHRQLEEKGRAERNKNAPLR